MERNGWPLEDYEVTGYLVDQSQKRAKERMVEYQSGAFKPEAVTMADIASRLQQIYEHISAIGVKLDNRNYEEFTQTLENLKTQVDLNHKQIDSLFAGLALVKADLAKLSNLPDGIDKSQEDINELQKEFEDSVVDNKELLEYQRQIAQRILNIEELMRKVAEEGEINFSANQR